MSALKNMPISFPGLFGDWEFNPDVAIHIGPGIYWYGIILAVAMLAGLLLCMKQARRFGLTQDHVLDVVLWGVPCCIVGARAYYVLFYLDLYRNSDGSFNWLEMLAVRDGGLAIYGAVIAGVLVALVYSHRKKIPFFALTDLAVEGLLLGQVIGRWANFINREAFGGPTTLPWRMRLWVSQQEYIEVHPTFFYESLWNFIGLMLILFVVSKGRRFDGENTGFYFLWYGVGRAWIEGLRTDSLYLFDWTIFGQPIRVSQALSVVLALGALVFLIYNIRVKKRTAQTLWVSQQEEAARRKAAIEAADAAAVAELMAEPGEDAAQAQTQPETPRGEDPKEPENPPQGGTEDAPARAGEGAPAHQDQENITGEARKEKENGDCN